MTQPLNPVELEIARNRLESIAEEVGLALIKTSYSPNIKDRRDCSAGLYTPDGTLISQAEHIPLHLGVMPEFIRTVLNEYGVDNLVDGDVLITNNPYLRGSHLPDACVITPIFVDERLVAVVANMAHHVDVGGIAPGSMATYATEIFQEGIRIPPVKLYSAGELQRELLNVLMTNVRTADKTRGDLMAQVAANRLGERRVEELVQEWGAEYFIRACEELADYAERRTRTALESLPDGSGEFTDHLEHNGVGEERLEIHVAVTKSGDRLTVDFSKTDLAGAGAVNCSAAVTQACVAYVVKLIADATLPSNAGLMRPITVRTRPGTLVDAQFPDPVSNGNIQTAQRIVDTLLGAFHQIAPDLVPAASSGSMSIMTIGGRDFRTGRYFSYVETYGGGQGAMPGQDGAHAIHTHMTNTRNTPCEVIEQEYPLRVGEYAVADRTGGAGEYTGGDGLIRTLTLVGGEAVVIAGTARTDQGPWGLNGGADGAKASVEYIRRFGEQDEATELQEAMSRGALASGDAVRIQTAGGGGYGAPRQADN
ncbi:hydantoinase B/oxoprolinase family protein [Micrococcoides hystricis]|uniref:Hydantoinase B/oxoprolinase family protein n=1 Tax=Micrococcoides hystricis TaxID=1572761 RepID=A0ABV6P6X5_9MICC